MKKKKGFVGLVMMGLLFCGVLTAFVFRMLQVQIVDEALYVEKRNMEGKQERVILAARGQILLRDGSPVVRNVIGNNIVFDAAKMPKEIRNDNILKLSRILSDGGEKWIDTLPMSYEAPFSFLPGEEEAVDKLKEKLDLQLYATEENVIDKMVEYYEIPVANHTPEEVRIIAGVRYEMAMAGFSDRILYTFAENVSMETALRIREGSGLYYPGVTIAETPNREYVNGSLVPHLLGTVNKLYKEDYELLKDKGYSYDDVVGKGGIEEAFEDVLRGENGLEQITKDYATGELLSEEVMQAQVPGNTVTLTIEPRLQQVGLASLDKTIQALRASGKEAKDADAGAVTAIDIETGEILVSAQYPSYDISQFRLHYAELAAAPGQPLFNKNIQGLYAPGSTYKPSIALAGLSEGVIEPKTTVYCGRVYTFYPGYSPKCLGHHGNINVLTALQKSCNIFFYDTGRILGIDRINKYSTMLGLGQATGIEVKESIGHLATPDYATEKANTPWVPGDVLQASIGQSYNLFTPLQLANYAATIARDGRRLETHLVKEISTYNGDQVVKKTEPVLVETIPTLNDNFQTVKEGMLMATRPGGTSSAYWSGFPLPVASKTGTPQTGTGETAVNSVYICYLPADNPKIAIAVIVEKGWHGYTGATVARDISNAYFLDDYNVSD